MKFMIVMLVGVLPPNEVPIKMRTINRIVTLVKELSTLAWAVLNSSPSKTGGAIHFVAKVRRFGHFCAFMTLPLSLQQPRSSPLPFQPPVQEYCIMLSPSVNADSAGK
ncbi:MAG: hypothetical protein ACOYM2_14820 [Rectinemataceae bacterium]